MARFEVGDRVEALFDRPDRGLQGWIPGMVVERPEWFGHPGDVCVVPDGYDEPFWFLNLTGDDIRRLET